MKIGNLREGLRPHCLHFGNDSGKRHLVLDRIVRTLDDVGNLSRVEKWEYEHTRIVVVENRHLCNCHGGVKHGFLHINITLTYPYCRCKGHREEIFLLTDNFLTFYSDGRHERWNLL